MIKEYCYKCQKDTETLERRGGDCKDCGLSKVTPKILCSFCGNDQTQSKNLIAGGPNFNESDNGHPVYICNECNQMVADLTKESNESSKRKL